MPLGLQVQYCPLCTFPLEYCVFSKTKKDCLARMKDEHPDLYELYSQDQPTEVSEGE